MQRYNNTDMLKQISVFICSALALGFFSTVYADQQSFSRQAFIDQQIEQLVQAEERQKALTERNLSMLKQALSAKDFAALMAQEEADEQAEHKRMATCLGITENEFKQYREQFDTQFQIDLVQTCASSLPEKISLTSGGWQNNADLMRFQACAEAAVAKATSIPEQRLAECSVESDSGTATSQVMPAKESSSKAQ